MPPTDLESPPDSPPQASLEYVRASAPVTRRQFRFLIFLTLLNTILFAWFVVGPAASGFIHGQWKEYQARRQLRQAHQKQDAFLQQCGAYALSPEQVVYEENPQEALKLLNSTQSFTVIERSPFQTGMSPREFIAPSWQVPALRRDDPVVTQLRSTMPNGTFGRYATVLLHNLRNSRGEQRLVWVIISGEQQPIYNRSISSNTVEYDSGIDTQRTITAMLIEKKNTGQALPAIDATAYRTHLLPQTPDYHTIIHWKKKSDNPGGFGVAFTPIAVTPKGLFRFYAAQIDPNDPSHFTIDYALDGQRNTIDGHLKDDDTIVFTPRSGRITGETEKGKVWSAPIPPATEP